MVYKIKGYLFCLKFLNNLFSVNTCKLHKNNGFSEN